MQVHARQDVKRWSDTVHYFGGGFGERCNSCMRGRAAEQSVVRFQPVTRALLVEVRHDNDE